MTAPSFARRDREACDACQRVTHTAVIRGRAEVSRPNGDWLASLPIEIVICAECAQRAARVAFGHEAGS